MRLPNTTVEIVLLGPARPGASYSAIFRSRGDSGGTLASVDAGDNGLYVGGGTINAAFKAQIGPDADRYQKIHEDALASARAGEPVSTGYSSDSPVRLVSVVLSSTDPGTGICPAETVFLDIFAKGRSPNGEPGNYALVYAVPPDGNSGHTPTYANAAEFLGAVTRTAANCVAVIADYNARLIAVHPELGLELVTVLRTCLFSGGAFRPASLAPSDVAKAIYAGFASALVAVGKAGGIDCVELESANGEFAAIEV